jgi:hypothetical protein
MRGRSHDKFSWSYLAIELLIVTLGVLFALALGQWIETRHERAESRLLLRAVQNELRSINTELDGELAFRKAMTESANKIFALAAADAPPTRDALEPLLGNLLWYSDTDFPIGAIDSILVGGKLRLIENEDVRYFLASLPGRLEIVKKVERQDYELQMNVVAPYLRTHANTPQIVASMTTRPGSTQKGEPFFSYAAKEIRDHSPLLKDSEFLGVVVQSEIVQSNVIDVYTALRPDLNKVIGLLDAELAD